MTDQQRPASEGLETRGTPTDVPPSDKPVPELLADVTAKVAELLRQELEMAKVELKDEVRQAAKAGGMLGGAALLGYFSALLASFGLAWWFDRKLPRWMAFFLVAGLQGAAAAALAQRGREEMLRVDPVPTQTVETLKESVEWAKAQAG
ncbi:MAG: phage holin family protein [Actinomycetota bacterium]|nr:phage holin family protein [Actinomycetota bacterium]